MGARDAGSKNRSDGNSGRTMDYEQFVHRVLITVGIVTLFTLLLIFAWQTIDVLLLVYTGMLFGLILDALAGLVSRFTHLRRGVALLVSIMLICALLAFVSLLAVPRVSEQFGQFRERLPQA